MAGAGSCLHGQPLAPGLCQPSSLAEAVMKTCRILCTFYPNLDAISDVKDVALGQSPTPPKCGSPFLAAPDMAEGAIEGLHHP